VESAAEDGAGNALLLAFSRSRAERAFRPLYDATAPAMLGFALRLSAGEQDLAEDLVQEAWFRALGRLDRFVATGSAVRWLNGFVLNCWRERHRVELRESPLGDEALEQSTTNGAELWNEAPVVERALASLSVGYRAVIVLHDVEGYTHGEIAAQLGIEEGTSKSRLSRARRRLRAVLGSPDREAHAQ
jgi:RNA polymerase sigma-70 factor (ECF subfamily)